MCRKPRTVRGYHVSYPETQLQASRGDFLPRDDGSRGDCGPIRRGNVFAPRIMLCRKARRQSQYVERPLKAWLDDKIEVFKSQKDQETENPKQNEPEIGEELTCCISCRYFGFRSELMMDGGNPTRGNFFDDRNEASTGVQPVGVSAVELIRGKVREDGARRMKLWTFGEAQADLGEISDNRIFFDPAVAEYSAGIAGHAVLFFELFVGQ